MSKKRRIGYLKFASQRFLNDLPYASPLEAVEAGARSLRQWCDCLNDARAAYGLTHEPVESVDFETDFEFSDRSVFKSVSNSRKRVLELN